MHLLRNQIQWLGHRAVGGAGRAFFWEREKPFRLFFNKKSGPPHQPPSKQTTERGKGRKGGLAMVRRGKGRQWRRRIHREGVGTFHFGFFKMLLTSIIW